MIPTMPRIRLSLLAALLALAPAPARAAAPEDPLAGDARLRGAITLRRPRVYLGELLEALSQQSGVRLSVSDAKGPVSGIELSFFVKGRPLREVMTALAELFTHRWDRWEWQRSKSEPPAYVLQHQRDPASAQAAARAEILKRWSADLKAYHDIARAPAAERAARAAARPDLFPGGIAPGSKTDVLATLTPAQLDSLLRGAEVSFSRSDLPTAIRGALDLGQAVGAGFAAPARAKPGFHITWERRFLSPMLWLRNESGNSLSVVGGPGWDAEWMRDNGDGWLHQRSPEVYEYFRRTGKRDPGAGGPVPARNRFEWLAAAADRQGLDLISDLVYPRGSQGIRSGWLGVSLEQTVLALISRGQQTGRASGSIQLFRDPTAATDPRRHLVAWRDVQRLRQSASRRAGYLDLPDLLFLSLLSPERLAGLFEEFPDANSDVTPHWRPIFEFLQRLAPHARAALQSGQGLPFAEAGLVARAALTEGGPDPKGVVGLALIAGAPRQAVLFLRTEEVEVPPIGESPARKEKRLTWEVRVPEARPHRVSTRYSPRKPLQPE